MTWALTMWPVSHGRAEEFAQAHRESFDLVTSRAVADLQLLSELCLPLVKPGGAFLAMKSVECGPELERQPMPLNCWAAGWNAPRITRFPVLR